MDPKKKMSFDDLQNLFSATDEFQITQKEENLAAITLIDQGPGYTKATTQLIQISTMNMQQVIRKIASLKHNMLNDILDD
jgi:hypothetical protein